MTSCGTCGGPIEYFDPTGDGLASFWSHVTHPDDGHNAHPAEDLDDTSTGNPDGISAPLDPDCRDGKHSSCTGTAFDEREDVITSCACTCHGWNG